MTDEWVETTLGEVANIQQGRTLAVKDMVGGPHPVYGANGVIGYFKEGSYDFPTVALGCRGSCGSVHVAPAGAFLANNVMGIWPKSGQQAIVEFLALLLEVADLVSSGVVSGQVQPQITRRSLAALPVVLPPLAVQRRIVDLMAHLDNHIANLRAERDGLEEALTIACLEFTAERQGVPLSPISDVAEILDRLRVPISEKVRAGRPGNVPYFGANGQVGWIDEAIFDEPLVLLAEDGGPVAEWRTRPQAYAVDGPCWVNNHAHVLRATAVPRDWLYFSLRHRDLTALAPVGTRSKLTQASLKEIQISLPLDLEEKSEQLRSMEDSVSALEGEIAACRSLRSTVLGAVLSRELAIPEAYDALLPEVA